MDDVDRDYYLDPEPWNYTLASSVYIQIAALNI